MVRGLTQVLTKHLLFALFGQTFHLQIKNTSSEDGEDHYVLCCGKVQELMSTGVAHCQTGVIQGSHMVSTSTIS